MNSNWFVVILIAQKSHFLSLSAVPLLSVWPCQEKICLWACAPSEDSDQSLRCADYEYPSPRFSSYRLRRLYNNWLGTQADFQSSLGAHTRRPHFAWLGPVITIGWIIFQGQMLQRRGYHITCIEITKKKKKKMKEQDIYQVTKLSEFFIFVCKKLKYWFLFVGIIYLYML